MKRNPQIEIGAMLERWCTLAAKSGEKATRQAARDWARLIKAELKKLAPALARRRKAARA